MYLHSQYSVLFYLHYMPVFLMLDYKRLLLLGQARAILICYKYFMSNKYQQMGFQDDDDSFSQSKTNKNNKKIKKSHKEKQSTKEIKRQRERNRRANHKQYVAQLENKVRNQQKYIDNLEVRVKQLEQQLETQIHIQQQQKQPIPIGSQSLYCAHCKQTLITDEYEEQNGINTGQSQENIQQNFDIFFRDQSSSGFRIGTRSQCFLLMTIFCLIACVIAHNPSHDSNFLLSSSIYDSICTFSFLDFLQVKKQEVRRILDEEIWMYQGTMCLKPRIITDIPKVIENSWIDGLGDKLSMISMETVMDKIWDFLSLFDYELIEKIATSYNRIPHHTTLLFANMIRINGY